MSFCTICGGKHYQTFKRAPPGFIHVKCIDCNITAMIMEKYINDSNIKPFDEYI